MNEWRILNAIFPFQNVLISEQKYVIQEYYAMESE